MSTKRPDVGFVTPTKEVWLDPSANDGEGRLWERKVVPGTDHKWSTEDESKIPAEVLTAPEEAGWLRVGVL